MGGGNHAQFGNYGPQEAAPLPQDTMPLQNSWK